MCDRALLPVQRQLYIPLCLYLYTNQYHEKLLAIAFTFHYVYIYIALRGGYQSAAPFFTFHYVYIYMQSSIDFARVYINFTFHYVYIYMGLVYLCIGTPQVLYIPLCLYLYSGKSLHVARNIYLYIPLCLYLYIITTINP